MGTVLLEVIRNQITMKKETETEKQQKAKYLMQQQAHIVDWIQKFDPENVNFEDLNMPKQLKTLQNYSSNLVRLLPEFLDQTVNHRLK